VDPHRDPIGRQPTWRMGADWSAQPADCYASLKATMKMQAADSPRPATSLWEWLGMLWFGGHAA
jgi:hypothetical protein